MVQPDDKGRLENKYVTKQGYRCKDCKRFFIKRDGFEGRTYPKWVIVQVLHLYAMGLSLADIRDFMWQHHATNRPIRRSWVKSYSKLVEKFERRMKPKIKGRIHVDDLVLKVGKKDC